jgi:hypothetical protein
MNHCDQNYAANLDRDDDDDDDNDGWCVKCDDDDGDPMDVAGTLAGLEAR